MPLLSEIRRCAPHDQCQHEYEREREHRGATDQRHRDAVRQQRPGVDMPELATANTTTSTPSPKEPPLVRAIDEPGGGSGIFRRDAGDTGDGERAERGVLTGADHNHRKRNTRQIRGRARTVAHLAN